MTTQVTASGPGVSFVKRYKSYYVDGALWPGVTTLLRDGYPKPNLIDWAADEAAKEATEHWDELAELSLVERYKRLSKAHRSRRDKAAAVGTDVHVIGERLVTGVPVEVPDELRGRVEAYARFLDRWDVQPRWTEQPVLHLAHGWAGTLDLRGLCGGEDWLLDLKNAKAVYDENALQLAAYAHAEYWLDERTGQLEPWTRPDRVGVVLITPDSAELIPVDASDRTYNVFRHAAWVARWRQEATQAWKERRPWPVGSALTPPPEEAP